MSDTILVAGPPIAAASLREDARHSLDRLFAVGDLLSDAAAESLDQLLFGEPEPAESEWVRRIEGYRAELERSSTEIPIALPYPGAKDRRSTVGEICRRRSKRRLWGVLFHKLVREMGAVSALELGTCMGVSTAYLAAALERNQRGRLTSLEGASALAAIASNGLQTLGLSRVQVRAGLFQNTLAQVLRELPPLDFVYIDGHHDEHATLAYLDQILPCLAPRAMLVFDDIAWSEGMIRAWSAIRSDPRLPISLDLATVGVCLVAAGLPTLRLDFPPLSRVMAADHVPRVQKAARELLPSGSSVLVVSRGDDRLLEMDGLRALHFPQTADGTYAGYYPSDSGEAIAQLEGLRGRGAEFLLFPSTSFWWLDYYAELKGYLERYFPEIHRDEECAIYRLAGA